MKSILSNALSVLVLVISFVGSAEPYLGLGFGLGLGKVGKSQYYSPYPGLTDYYVTDNKWEIAAPLVNLGAGYRFHLNQHHYFELGVEADYISWGDAEGTRYPGVNLPTKLDTLSYSYSAESYLLMLQGKFGNTSRAWLPYLSLGVGLSFNALSGYHEIPNGSVAPPQKLYKNNSTQHTAYSVALGLYSYHTLNHRINFNIEYRFIYAGEGILKNPDNGTDAINSGALKGNFLVASLHF